MKKFVGFIFVAVMVFAMVLPAVAEEAQTIYLKGDLRESNFNEKAWQNTFKITDDVGENPRVWHIVYTGDVNQVTAMQLDFGDNDIWEWNPSMGFSTNQGDNNQGWVVLAPFGWKIEYVNKGNNNESNSFVVTNDTSNPQFNISSYKGGKQDDPVVKGELKIKKYVDGTFIGEWLANLNEDEIREIISNDLIKFEVYAVEFDGDDNFAQEVGMGFLREDGTIEFQSNEDGTNKFVPGWYAIVEILDGIALMLFENEDGKVGPLYVYLGKGGVMSSITEPNLEGDFRIQYTGGYAWDIKLIYADGKVFNGGQKPDGSGQQLSTERFDTILPDGTVAPSFCSDLGAHQVWGKYKFDETNHGFSDDDMLYLIAALDYINENVGGGLYANPGKALAQIIVWNLILKVDGDAGYAAEWYKDSTLMKIEGADGWYTSEYEYLVNDIIINAEKYIDIYNDRPKEGAFVSGVVFVVGNDDNYAPIDQQRQVFVLFGEGIVFENKAREILGSAVLNKVKIGGIVNQNAVEGEFFFDLFRFEELVWVPVNDEPYATSATGTVTISDLVPGYYRVTERSHEVWTIEQQYVNGIFFTIDDKGNTIWDFTVEEAPVVVNKPALGQSYGTITATNEGNREAILAGLNPKNGNALFDAKNPEDPTKSTPFVVPNSNNFVFAKLSRADLEQGVILDMMMGNKFEVVGKALVKLTDGQIEVTINGEGRFGAIAFNKLPVFNNGNIQSQKLVDLAKFGALTGFNHDNNTLIPCPAGNTIYLYIHCDPIQFYNEILAW